jgi:hypothetical protein
MEDRRRRKRYLSRWAVAALSVGMGSLRPHLTLSLSLGESTATTTTTTTTSRLLQTPLPPTQLLPLSLSRHLTSLLPPFSSPLPLCFFRERMRWSR